MKISIITVCYNSSNCIEKTLKSVISQKSPNYEYIVIDGKSSDNTLEIINKYKEKISVIISEPDKGIYDAMNKGVSYAHGDYVLFINSGDSFYSSSTLGEISELIDGKKDLYYGDIENIMDYGNVIVKPESIGKIATNMVFSHQAVLTKRSLLLDFPFDLHFRYAADYDFLSKMYFQGRTFEYINIIICTTPIEEGATYSNKQKSLSEHRAILKKNGTYNPLLFALFLWDSYKSFLLKKILPSIIRKKILKIKNIIK